jgi:LAO/AO transport system kinase
MVHLRSWPADAWRPPVVKTSAVQDQGVDTLIDLLFQHRRHLESTGQLAQRRTRNEWHFFRQLVLEKAAELLLRDCPELSGIEHALGGGGIDPYTAAEGFVTRRLKV